jgi:dGTPase
VNNPHILPSLLDAPTTIKILDGQACKPPKSYHDSEQDIVDWVLALLSASDREAFQSYISPPGKHGRSLHKSLDCSIMDAADDIAYGVHDLEDAIALGLVTRDGFASAIQDRCPTFLDALKEKYPGESANDVFSLMLDGLFGGAASRKRFIGRLVHHFLTAVEYVENETFSEPLLRYRVRVRDGQRQFLDALQDFVVREVITSPAVQHLEFKGQAMVIAVFEAMQADPVRLLPRDELLNFEQASGDLRIICDYVAAMTDTHLLKTYERLFSPRMGSVFDRL